MVRNITQRLITGLELDILPDITVMVDFGLDCSDPTERFGALQWAWRRELVTAEELDVAICNGKALTEIANRKLDGRSNPYACEFVTAYDLMDKEDEEEEN